MRRCSKLQGINAPFVSLTTPFLYAITDFPAMIPDFAKQAPAHILAPLPNINEPAQASVDQ
jgi:hypothetical protein